MAEVDGVYGSLTENLDSEVPNNLPMKPSGLADISAKNTNGGYLQQNMDESEDDAPKKRVKKRIQNFSDSDSDNDGQNQNKDSGYKEILKPESDSDSDMTIFKTIPRKSRIQNNESSDSDSSKSEQAVKNQEQQVRMKNKREKLKNKFQDLKSSRGKDQSHKLVIESDKSSSDISDDSNDESSSIEKIKQKMKERMSFIPSICDPDTSDDENSHQKSVPKQKKERRTTKLTSPKPQRMTAKQAMENMQKIKSESNRMLREKEVSLPYHRPKALSLKDIMSRRKPAVSADGKSLPIKMNGEQLRQYAQQLEERQKQMMELWKSDSDDDENDQCDNEKESCGQTIDEESTKADKEVDEPMQTDLAPNETDKYVDKTAEDNDKLFDDMSQSVVKEPTTLSNSLNDDSSNEIEVKAINSPGVSDEQDSETSIKLVFNDSDIISPETSETEDRIEVEKEKVIQKNEELNKPHELDNAKTNTEDSQIISLQFDTERLDGIENEQTEILAKESTDSEPKVVEDFESIDKNGKEEKAMEVDDFSDDDMYIEDIDNIIENAEIIRDIEDKINSQVLIRDINVKPKLTGAPGMVIDLDAINTAPKKTGIELLKERFTYFAKLKTPEELERQREKKIKPGTQHSKLKQVLEEQMAEQRSIEWTKRLEKEKQHQKELKELRGEESDDENDIDKIEAKLEGDGDIEKAESESEEELEENDVEMKDKPRVKNPLLENEAEESDCDENVDINSAEPNDEIEDGENENEDDEENGEEIDNDYDDSSDNSSSESEGEQAETRKGRILKAFEDSDDEDTGAKTEQITKDDGERKPSRSVDLMDCKAMSQDDVLTLAQRHKSVSDDLFSTQGSSSFASQIPQPESLIEDDVVGTQTFSILDSTKNATVEELHSSENLDVICETQPFDDNLDAVAAMCSGSFTQSVTLALPVTQLSQSQPIGEDLLALCTGKFYDNEFVSQVADNNQLPLGASQEFDSLDDGSQMDDGIQIGKETYKHVTSRNSVSEELGATQVILGKINVQSSVNEENVNSDKENNIPVLEETNKPVDDNLKSILDELGDPEFDTPKPNKFFCGAKTQKRKEVAKEIEVERQIKKRFIIDSDDETNDDDASKLKKRKKLKKKKPEKRALQISDDEDEASDQEEIEYESEIDEENPERLVEYDSEENEVEVVKQKPLSKKKRKGTDFFEQEAELTSEDEWVGSGDEDEAGLDRMEREEGDDESFHQGRLQRELGQIHMRDVLDQDKREVRIIQELLFEDGDLGGGGRQRKFKWKNLDGVDETGGTVDEFGDTQEEEFESEEQWRKQRHERETFLRQMQNNGETDESLNVSINRTTIIKANLSSKSVSMLLEESAAVDKTDPVVPEKKIRVPSPKKPFSLLQQSYQGSNRGRGALARLAALATPLAVDDDAPKVGSVAHSSRRNFVFANLTPEAPKVTKRKAEANPSTPKLVKKMKTGEKQNIFKSSLLDHMKV